MKNNQGFTLIELLIVIAIIGILVVYLLAILNNFLKTRSTAQKLDALQNTATLVFNDINQEFHLAKSVAFVSPDDKMTLEVYDINDPTVINTISYSYDSTNLKIFKDAQALTPDEVKITGFIITNMAAGSLPLLKIELELEYPSSVKKAEYKVVYEDSMTVSLRLLE